MILNGKPTRYPIGLTGRWWEKFCWQAEPLILPAVSRFCSQYQSLIVEMENYTLEVLKRYTNATLPPAFHYPPGTFSYVPGRDEEYIFPNFPDAPRFTPILTVQDAVEAAWAARATCSVAWRFC